MLGWVMDQLTFSDRYGVGVREVVNISNDRQELVGWLVKRR